MGPSDEQFRGPLAAPGSAVNGGKPADAPWTITCGSITGVRLRLHLTLPIALIALYLLPINIGGGSLPLAILIMSLSLFVHEIAHALTARHYGAKVKSVVLYPLRAVVFAEGAQLNPHQAMRVLAAGPAANLAVSFIVWAGLALATGSLLFSAGALHKIAFSTLLTRVALINGLVAAVNLLPALPFDGGRALLLLLTRRLEQTKAIAVVLQVSLILSCGLGILALTTHVFILSLLGVMITLGATREAQIARNQPIDFQGETAESLMDESAIRLTIGESATGAAARLKGSRENVFPVFQGRELVGLVSRLSLARGIARRGEIPYVAELMKRNYAAIPADSEAITALNLLSRSPFGAIAVLAEGDYVGLITEKSIRRSLEARTKAQLLSRRQGASTSAEARRDRA